MIMLRSLRKKEDGVASVQFVVLASLILMLFTFAFDFSMAMTRSAMLERAMGVETRNLRIGARAADDYDGIRKGICDAARLIPNCLERVKLEVKAMTMSKWEAPNETRDCQNLQKLDVEDPAARFDAAQSNQIVLLRACVVFKAVSPTGLLGGVLLHGGENGTNKYYPISVVGTYVMEP